MDERDETRREQLFDELAETGSMEVRNELVERYAPLAEYFARRYRQPGRDNEDVRQVAQLALVKAVDRFDPTVGVQFSTFAGKTINGELKRYLRDRTWSVRVPRGLLETAVEVRELADRLAIETGRQPTVADLAARSGYDPDLVLQALNAQLARVAKSIDRPVVGPSGGDAETTISAQLGQDDPAIDLAEVQMSIRSLLETLDDRRREIVVLRFYGGLTQQEIADRVGISQMHVSRLLRQALEDLRDRYTR